MNLMIYHLWETIIELTVRSFVFVHIDQFKLLRIDGVKSFQELHFS